MPWTCPYCNGETDLGYNICWTCQAARPGSDATTDAATVAARNNLLITTTPSFSTHSIDCYFGPVFGETIFGANILRDFFASFTDIVGGRSGAYESLLLRGRDTAISEMSERAMKMGANAIVGMRFDYSTVGESMLMICCLGTAVRVTASASKDGE